MTSTKEPVRFDFFIINNMPLVDYPDISRRLKNSYRSVPNKVDRLNKVILPILEQIGFFDKTQFEALSVCFDLVQPPTLAHKIKISVQRTDPNCLFAEMTFHEEELLSGLERDFVGFVTKHIATVLRVICEKYKLDPTPINDLDNVRGIYKEYLGASSTSAQFLEENKDELHVHIKLSDRAIGKSNDLMTNLQIIEELEDLLASTGSGEISGHEVGMGYETIFCVGDNGSNMYNRLLEQLKMLPPGSYVEILSNGKKDRRYPVE